MELFNQQYKLNHISKFIIFFQDKKINIKEEKEKSLCFLNNFIKKINDIYHFKEIDNDQFDLIQKNYENTKNHYNNNLLELNKISILIDYKNENESNYEKDIFSLCKQLLDIIYPYNLLNNDLNSDFIKKLNIKNNHFFLNSLIYIEDENHKNFNYYKFYNSFLKNLSLKELAEISDASAFQSFFFKTIYKKTIYKQFEDFKKIINWRKHPFNKDISSFYRFITTINHIISIIEKTKNNYIEYLRNNDIQHFLTLKSKFLNEKDKYEIIVNNKIEFFRKYFCFDDCILKINLKNTEMLCKKYNTNYSELIKHLYNYQRYSDFLMFTEKLEPLSYYIKYHSDNEEINKKILILIDIIFNLILIKNINDLEISKILPVIQIFKDVNDSIDDFEEDSINNIVNFKLNKIKEQFDVSIFKDTNDLLSNYDKENNYFLNQWNIKDIDFSDIKNNQLKKIDTVLNF